MIKEFQLGAVNWSVEVDNDGLTKADVYGLAVFDESKVLIQEKLNGKLRERSAVEQVLYHEVVHCILNTMGEHDLATNERFVQQFSLLLHQFEVTKK